MKRARVSFRVLVCSMAVVGALAPGWVHAQADQDRPMVRVGPFQFSPRLSFTNVGIDYNVFNERTNPKRDFTFVAVPDLEVALHPGRLRLTYTSDAEFVYFREFTSERSVNRHFGATADLDLTLLKPFATVSFAHTSARPNAEIDVRARHHPRSYTAGTRLKLATRSEMVFTMREARDAYDEGLEFRGVELAQTLDQKTRAYDTAFNVALTPFTTVGLVVSKEQEQFQHSPLRNSDTLRIAPKVTFSPLGLISGSASVGYRRFRGVDPTLPDFSGLVSSGSLGILFVSRYKLDTSFTRDVQYSYEAIVPYYLVTGVRGTLAMQTVGLLELRALGGRQTMDYRASAGAATPGADRMISYGAGAGYRVGQRARVVVDLEFLHRTSTRDVSREYRNHRIVASLTWGALNR
jgi:Putative beta-barrel porin 2